MIQLDCFQLGSTGNFVDSADPCFPGVTFNSGSLSMCLPLFSPMSPQSTSATLKSAIRIQPFWSCALQTWNAPCKPCSKAFPTAWLGETLRTRCTNSAGCGDISLLFMLLGWYVASVGICCWLGWLSICSSGSVPRDAMHREGMFLQGFAKIILLLLMEENLGYINPVNNGMNYINWCRISSINSSI